jgi:sulfur carrier protein ThiS
VAGNGLVEVVPHTVRIAYDQDISLGRSPAGPGAGSLLSMLVTARLRPPDRVVEVADVRRVADLLARLEVLPGAVLVIREGALLTSQDELRDGDRVEVRFAISGGA